VGRAGVIAIGSNSIRMLTAKLDSTLSQPVRARQETRLFLALSENRDIAPETAARLIAAVQLLKQQALDADAQNVYLTATSAVRDSRDSVSLKATLLQRTGLDLRILTGHEEAAYSFLGAVYPYENLPSFGVVDIGGGSTEIAWGSRSTLHTARSLQLGASRLYAGFPINDSDGLASALAQAERGLGNALDEFTNTPGRWLLVGGTGTALIGLLQGRLVFGEHQEDSPFTRGQAFTTLRTLAGLSLKERAELPGMTPGREHILPTGLAILCAMMARLNIDRMAVTARNNCDGFLYRLAAEHNKEEG
jgi:exopolyphosphatase/guanosine-5'-triphosphate,3'-diphosphate pyrophosphatase